MKKHLIIICSLLYQTSFATETPGDSARIAYFFKMAFQCPTYALTRQAFLDSVLMLDHRNAYAWQQKSMPLFKQKKYELGMAFIDSAVKYDKGSHWLEYRGFIKCIFQKSYRAAIVDLRRASANNPGGYVMDHSFDFYLGLCYLQLNRFDSAGFFIERSLSTYRSRSGFPQPTEAFYAGIVKMEKGQTHEAIARFEEALAEYGRFPDARYYLADCWYGLGEREKARTLWLACLESLRKEEAMPEHNISYEVFPYQCKKSWVEAALKR